MAVLTEGRLRGLAALAIAAIVAAAAAGRVAAQRSLEYEVKAGYIFNFVQFIDWPATAFSSPDVPFRICIAGADPFGSTIDRIVQGERIGDHPVTVERVPAQASLGRCQVVFASAQEDARARDLLKSITSTTVLTIGESPDFLEAGGAIAFAIDGGRVRFDINLRAPQVKDLRVSSKLLRVARNTWRGGN